MAAWLYGRRRILSRSGRDVDGRIRHGRIRRRIRGGRIRGATGGGQLAAGHRRGAPPQTRRINFRAGWRGHLWQGRFASFVMDEPYLLAAAVRGTQGGAGEVGRRAAIIAGAARAHLKGKDDGLVRVAPLVELAGNWRCLLNSAVSEEQLREFRTHEPTGRVLADDDFQQRLEQKLGRVPATPKPKLSALVAARFRFTVRRCER